MRAWPPPRRSPPSPRPQAVLSPSRCASRTPRSSSTCAPGCSRTATTGCVVQGEVRDLESLRPAEATDSAGVAHVVVDRVKLSPGAARPGDGGAGVGVGDGRRRGGGLHPARAPGASAAGLVCPKCAREFEPARPGLFSYQSPTGRLPHVPGFGRTIGIDWAKVVPDPTLSLEKGAIRPWTGKTSEWERKMLFRYAREHGIPLDVPWERAHRRRSGSWCSRARATTTAAAPTRACARGSAGWRAARTRCTCACCSSRYRAYVAVRELRGRAPQRVRAGLPRGRARPGRVARAGAVARRARGWRPCAPIPGQGELARRELAGRLGYLERVGLGYLTLDRHARTLSGGEAQRVSLTAALGTSLTGALFVLDEPTVGLHPADVRAAHRRHGRAGRPGQHRPGHRARSARRPLRDRVLELGPGAGKHGGKLCFDGTPQALAKRADLPTGRLLAGTAGGEARRRASARASWWCATPGPTTSRASP